MAHPNSLDLDPQDGDIELIEALEQAFGVQPTQAAVGHWLTLGDVHATLLAAHRPRPDGACPSQRAFHQLRAALVAAGWARPALRPDTRLDDLAGGNRRALLALLGRQTGLAMPWCRSAAMGAAGSWLFLIGLAGGVLLLGVGQVPAGLALLAVLAAGLCLMLRDKGCWPPGLATLGDLVDRVAALNHQAMTDVRDLPGTLWRRLTAIVAEQSDLAPQAMRADTLLFRPRRA